ncbi:MAG: A24 family peptidase C-terminal domain-containing protein [Thermoplasmata archaeon]
MYSIARLLIGLVFLLIASASDLKSRRVPDGLWIVLAVLAMGILAVELHSSGAPLRFMLIFAPIIFFLCEAFVEVPPLYEKSKLNFLAVLWFLVPIVSLVLLISTSFNESGLWPLIAIPVMMFFAFVLYYLRILYGGADAKAVIVLAVLVPYYPYIEGITNYGSTPELIGAMESLFPFVLVVLLNSSLILIFLPLIYFLLNLKNGDIGFPQMFFGFRSELKNAKESFVWPMEYYKNGERKIQLMPRGVDEDIYEDFSEGEQIWVTPKIPFIVPMCVGFFISFLIGNPLLHVL